jgi:alpha-galactosidase
MDFMDDTAIEGAYHRPNTTALEAQRIGLAIIRAAVGEASCSIRTAAPC